MEKEYAGTIIINNYQNLAIFPQTTNKPKS